MTLSNSPAPFKVIKDAPPIPPVPGGGVTIYPFKDMEVGDAFDAPRDMGQDFKGTDKRQAAILQAARLWRRRFNSDAKFSTRTLDDQTIRCWRVK